MDFDVFFATLRNLAEQPSTADWAGFVGGEYRPVGATAASLIWTRRLSD